MRPVITSDEAARLDSETSEPIEVLMERAGIAVALNAARMGVGYGSRVIVLAGPGNNGGDGYVAARHLKRRGVDVEVRALRYPKDEDSAARRAAAAAVRDGVRVRPFGEPEPAELVIDALFGVGLGRELPPMSEAWTKHDAPVLAVDLPSGLDADDGVVRDVAFTAARTVTFEASKVGHHIGRGPELVGDLEVVSIGLPDPQPAFQLADWSDAPVPSRPHDAHKWSAGSVAVVGGSAGMVGAAVMAAEAALRFGAGAVRLIVPAGLRGEAATDRPGIMTLGIGGAESFRPEDAGPIVEALGRYDVLVLGPGLGRGRGGLVQEILRRWDRPMVLDADGLAGATVEALTERAGATVITPHGGEFQRLVGEAPESAEAFRLATATGAVVLLKGSPTFIGGSQRWAVDSGGSELATVGTGDVLAGMIGALIARGLDPETAARSAAHRHGVAGRALAGVTSVTAVGLLDEIGRWAR